MRFDPRWLAPRSLQPHMTSREAAEIYIEPPVAAFALSAVVGFVMPWPEAWWWWASSFVMGAVVGHASSARVMRKVRARMDAGAPG